MYHYSLALSRPSFIMANSSWTKNRVDAILSHSDPVMNVMHFLNPLFILRLFATTFKSKKLHAGSASKKPEANIVYPPCDTREMAQFPLDERERIILSIAQFRYISILLYICYWSSNVAHKGQKKTTLLNFALLRSYWPITQLILLAPLLCNFSYWVAHVMRTTTPACSLLEISQKNSRSPPTSSSSSTQVTRKCSAGSQWLASGSARWWTNILESTSLNSWCRFPVLLCFVLQLTSGETRLQV